MIYKIATKNGVLYGAGVGEEVLFDDESLIIETFDNEKTYSARIKELSAR